MSGLQIRQLWAVDRLLGAPQDLDWIRVAICVDLPAQEVPWWDEPQGATSWLQVTRLDRQPVGIWWRSSRVPVWNHRIVRPLLVWDAATGMNEEHLAAIGEGRAADLGLPEPPVHALAERLRDEASISLAALKQRTKAYEEHRWGRGRLDSLADPLWRVADGYLDIVDAQTSLR